MLQGLSLSGRGSHVVTMDQLAALPEPKSLGNWHKPIPHIEVVNGLLEGIKKLNFGIDTVRLGVAHNGQRLFGTIDLSADDASNGWDTDMQSTLGFRSSVNKSLALRAVAGAHVFVCDNLMLSGDEILFSRKSTLHMNLMQQINSGLEQFLYKQHELQRGVQRLKEFSLKNRIHNGQAKERIFDLLEQKILPTRCFEPICTAYFEPEESWTDCHGNTLWSLQNACTRATKILSPQARFNTENKVGKHFLALVNN